MPQHKLISVLIPTYNAGDYLREAVLSIIDQTYRYLEIIIIDDGSTDNCIDTISDISDSRIRIIRQENKGKAAALNRAWSELKGDFFIIQDADDKSYSLRIEAQLKCMEWNSRLAAVYVGHDLVVGGKQFAPIFEEINEKECKDLIDKFKMPAHDATGMYRVSLLGNMRFDEVLRIGQGVDFVLRVGEKYPIKRLGECLYSYRINYDSTIRQDIRKTVDSRNIVRNNACLRRGIIDLKTVEKLVCKKKRFLKHREADVHIVSHCMCSVVDLKGSGDIFNALFVGWQCLMLHPLDLYYCKPLVYALMPLKLIDLYRKNKL